MDLSNLSDDFKAGVAEVRRLFGMLPPDVQAEAETAAQTVESQAAADVATAASQAAPDLESAFAGAIAAIDADLAKGIADLQAQAEAKKAALDTAKSIVAPATS